MRASAALRGRVLAVIAAVALLNLLDGGGAAFESGATKGEVR
jgi:hypothetical protein